MRTLGLLGGMTYHSTLLYYEWINKHVAERAGGNNTAKIVLHSFNYADIIAPFHAGDEATSIRQLSEAALGLKAIGADALVLCVNTSHKWAGDIERATGLPLLHIADAAGEALRAAGHGPGVRLGLLGTRLTMEGDFVRGRLEAKFGLDVLLPPDDARAPMDRVIFEELNQNLVTDAARALYRNAVADLVRRGADAVLLACTELQTVLKPQDVDVPLFDTVDLHARFVAQWAIDN